MSRDAELLLKEQLEEERRKVRLKGFINCNGIQVNPEWISKIESSTTEYSPVRICIKLFLAVPSQGTDVKFECIYCKTIEEYQQAMSDINAIIAERVPAGPRQPRAWDAVVSKQNESGSQASRG